MRVREWGIQIGRFATGSKNAITDVPGVRVGHASLIRGRGALTKGTGPVRTGVTAIWPASGNLFDRKVRAAAHVINGFAKSVGVMQIQEMGTIETPLLITNTLNVGRCADALIAHLWTEEGWEFTSINPIVTECNDSYLNDILGRHVREEHVRAALSTARGGPVAEGNVGAGVGMGCYGFKGGIGTASRTVASGESTVRIGCLVCANMGKTEDLRVEGVQVGFLLAKEREELAALKHSPIEEEAGSIIALIATDAPLESRQLARLARRVTNGIARTGTFSGSGSGELAIAWSTSGRLSSSGAPEEPSPAFLPEDRLDPLFRAVADSTEESILDALWCARSMTGRDGNTRRRIPVESLERILTHHRPPADGSRRASEANTTERGGQV